MAKKKNSEKKDSSQHRVYEIGSGGERLSSRVFSMDEKITDLSPDLEVLIEFSPEINIEVINHDRYLLLIHHFDNPITRIRQFWKIYEDENKNFFDILNQLGKSICVSWDGPDKNLTDVEKFDINLYVYYDETVGWFRVEEKWDKNYRMNQLYDRYEEINSVIEEIAHLKI